MRRFSPKGIDWNRSSVWAACDSLPVVQAPLTPDRVIAWLSRNERFEVQGANRVVLVPGAVRMTKDTLLGPVGEQELFRAADTVYVLDYRSEAVFNIWHRGGVFRVDVFWPWRGQFWRPTGLAEVLQEPESEFWLRVKTNSGMRGWVRRGSEMLDIRALYFSGGGATPCDVRG